MNPEFRRNLWLEFSLERLLIIPAVVILSLVAVSGTLGYASAVVFATYGAIAISVVWGSTLASGSFLGEITGRTWDMQRASSLSGWQMTWGKLFGSTAYTWYGLGVVFAAWLLVGGAASFTRNQWLALVPTAVLAHALALTAALYIAIDGRVHTRSARQAAVVGALTGMTVFYALGGPGAAGLPTWYGLPVSRAELVAGSAWFLCFWALLSAWRAMSGALQIPLRPWAWPLFLLAFGAWVAGFVDAGDPQNLLSRRLYGAFAAVWIATWVSAVVDTKSPVRLRQWGAVFASGDLGRALALTPAWAVGLPIVVALAIGVTLADLNSAASTGLVVVGALVGAVTGGPLQPSPAWLTMLTAVLLLWRDIAIIYWSGLTMRGRRVPALIYLGMLYVLVPATLLGVELPSLLPAFVPMPFSGNGGVDAAFVILLVEVIVATAMATHALRRFTRLVP